MKVEFHTPEEAEVVVATATWRDGQASVESGDDEVAAKIWKIFRPTPVAIDDGSYRRQGTSGAVVVAPGSLEWFRAAVQTRSAEAGLVARFVPGVTEGGYDPAAGYRTFDDTIERLAQRSDP